MDDTKDYQDQLPGQAIFKGKQKQKEVLCTLIRYDQDAFEEKEIKRDEIGSLEKKPSEQIWLNIDGLHEANYIKELGNVHNIHPLIIEDILNTRQRPKLVVGEDHMFLILRMLYFSSGKLRTEQISFYLKDDFLITFQEKTGDVLEPVRDRLRKKLGRIRGKCSDYLIYCILDTIVDSYMEIGERFGGKVEELEILTLKQPDDKLLQKISSLKLKLNILGRNSRPLKDMIYRLDKTELRFIKKDTLPYIRDLQDLASQTHETVDYYKNMLSEQLMIYSTNVSNKLNDIMKVLTIFSAIFIPLTFIAGIYGMNFNSETSQYNMPELNSNYGYPIVLFIMLVCAIGMIIYFKKKKWI